MMPEDKPHRAVAIIGATASGKTALSIELCKLFDGEVVGCDSMQIYKGMDIGTAKPSEEEKQGVPHHLIDFLHVEQSYSAADYAEDALGAVTDICSRGKLAVFCGGTGMYLDSAESGRHASLAPSSFEHRERLQRIYEAEGADRIYEMLTDIDPEAAEAIHKNNVKRVIRALEIYYASGVTKTEWDRRSQSYPKKIELIKIGLAFNDRALLYSRIDKRVDIMMEAGLESEARALYEKNNAGITASQAIGYKELFEYFKGNCTREEAIAGIKTASRNYAKRQMTWFSRYDDVHWIYADKDGEVRDGREILSEAEAYLKNTINRSED